MNIISFAWTVDALLAGLKDVTRRDWPDKYASQFRPNNLVQAFDKGARNGGKCRAIIRLEDLHREPLARLTEDPAYGRAELVREGNLWRTTDDFLALFGELRHGHPYRIQFKLVEITGKQASLPLHDPVPTVHAEFCRLTGQQLKLSIFQAFWHELLHTHGFSPDDIAIVARYLARQVKNGKRFEGCLKIGNFADPISFNSELAQAKIAFAAKRPSAPPRQALPAPVEATDEERKKIADQLAAFRASGLRGPVK